MADDSLDQTPKADKDNLDLSGLSSFSLGPDWVSGKKPRTRLPKEAFDDRPKGPRGPRQDRRGGGPRKRARPERDRTGGRGPRDRHERHGPAEPFQPILAVDFYPEEEPFKVLSQAIKTSCRTFELFEIARLILEKPDRWVCVARDPSHKEGEPATLWACVPDGLPFQSEEEALAHTFRHYTDEFFNVETVEVEAPTGSFQMVHKCGMTGELLGPPNYHRYQAICREHHAAKLSNVPYAKFEQRLESTREEEDIQAWLTKMKTQSRYISKENPEQSFDNQEDARLYLVTQAKEKLVRPAYSARFSGKSLALLNPGSPIRRSIEYLLEGQNRFPLDTANHLRGRLRRMHFAVYKKGSKGVSYVCAVKRHFRKPDEVLADNLQSLVDFLEAHPNFPAKNLPNSYLGEVVPEPASEDGESKEQEPVEDSEAVKGLKNDLHYLVSQGYVIEYSDGRLFVPPIREDEIRHLEKQKALAEKAASEETPVEAPVAEAVDEAPVTEAPAVSPATEEAAPKEEPSSEKDDVAEVAPVEQKAVEEAAKEEVAVEAAPPVEEPVEVVQEDEATEVEEESEEEKAPKEEDDSKKVPDPSES